MIVLLLFFLLFNLNSYASRIDGFLKHIGKIKTLEIRFSQEVRIPAIGNDVDMYKGVILYKRPSRFKWKYTWGSRICIVSDGRFIYSVFPSEKRIEKTRIGNSTEGLPLIDILDRPSNFKKEFSYSVIGKNKKFSLIKITPRIPNGIFTRIDMLIDRNCRVRLFKTYQADGTKSTYIVNSWIENLKLSDNEFKEPKL
jgi:outer membrane lipoprotein carrier protein